MSAVIVLQRVWASEPVLRAEPVAMEVQAAGQQAAPEMAFYRKYLRGIALLPSLIQGIEHLFGADTGAQKQQAAISIVSSAINMADAVSSKQIVDANAFTAGLGQIIDGVVACLNASIWASSPVPEPSVSTATS